MWFYSMVFVAVDALCNPAESHKTYVYATEITTIEQQPNDVHIYT